METIPVRVVPRGFGETSRRDSWWLTPVAIFIGLSLFVVPSVYVLLAKDHRGERHHQGDAGLEPGAGPLLAPAGQPAE